MKGIELWEIATSDHQYPSDTIHTYYDITDHIPYAILYISMTVFITGNLYILMPSSKNCKTLGWVTTEKYHLIEIYCDIVKIFVFYGDNIIQF